MSELSIKISPSTSFKQVEVSEPNDIQDDLINEIQSLSQFSEVDVNTTDVLKEEVLQPIKHLKDSNIIELESEDIDKSNAEITNDTLVDLEKVNGKINELDISNETELNVNNEEDISCNKDWLDKERHIFILSSSGKPVYSRYGSEENLVTLFGLMQALVSFVQDSEDDKIQNIKAGNTFFSFLSKNHIIVVSVSKNCNNDTILLQRQLLYVYNQVISTLTLSQVSKIFEQHRNFDLRRLLSGSERLINTLLEFTESHVDFIMSSYRCLNISSSNRDSISNIISSSCQKIKNLVYAILIANNQIVTYIHMKKYNLRTLDIHLILNLVESSESFKTAEIWTPLCLPQFDASGYLYCHVSYLAEDCNACLLLMTIDKNMFHVLSDAKQVITEKLRRAKLLEAINDSISSSNQLLTSKLNITSLRHFVYKSNNTSQIISPKFESPYQSCQNVPFSYYSKLYCDLQREARPLKLYYSSRDTETLLGWVTTGFELYTIFEPIATKAIAINAVNKLLRWIKKEEDKMFMLNNYIL